MHSNSIGCPKIVLLKFAIGHHVWHVSWALKLKGGKKKLILDCGSVAANHSSDNSGRGLLTKWQTTRSSLIPKWRDKLTCIKSEKSSRIYTPPHINQQRIYISMDITTKPIAERTRISARLWDQIHLHPQLAVAWVLSLVSAKHWGWPQQHTDVMMPVAWLWCYSSVPLPLSNKLCYVTFLRSILTATRQSVQSYLQSFQPLIYQTVLSYFPLFQSHSLSKNVSEKVKNYFPSVPFHIYQMHILTGTFQRFSPLLHILQIYTFCGWVHRQSDHPWQGAARHEHQGETRCYHLHTHKHQPLVHRAPSVVSHTLSQV